MCAPSSFHSPCMLLLIVHTCPGYLVMLWGPCCTGKVLVISNQFDVLKVANSPKNTSGGISPVIYLPPTYCSAKRAY